MAYQGINTSWMKMVKFSLICLFFSSMTSASQFEKLTLSAGLWEGISETAGADYYLLHLTENGNHRLLVGNIWSAFKDIKIHSFKDENIQCQYLECSLTIENKYEHNANIKLIITPHLTDSLKVMEIIHDNNLKPVLTQTYQLDKKTGHSTIKEFITRYRHRLTSGHTAYNDQLHGFWIGVAEIRSKKQLIVLDIKPEGKSELVLMINGSSITNETYFSIDDISTEQQLIKISTSHLTFANQIMLHRITENSLKGHFYSYYQEQAIEPTNFWLHRVSKKDN